MGFFTKKSNGKAEAAKPGSLSDAIPSLASTKPVAAAALVSAPLLPPAAPAAFTAAAVATQATMAASAPTVSSPPASLPPDELAKQKANSKTLAAIFGEIVTLMMRQTRTSQRTLADLEWMVLPALQAKQYSLAEAQSRSQGYTAPVAVIMWARVSPEVDKRLCAVDNGAFRLAAREWTSGDIIWLVEAIGEKRVLTAMIQKLRADEWAGKTVKVRTAGADGKTSVKTMSSTGQPV